MLVVDRFDGVTMVCQYIEARSRVSGRVSVVDQLCLLRSQMCHLWKIVDQVEFQLWSNDWGKIAYSIFI